MQNYHEMSGAQARVYFEQFMSEMDASRDRLASMLREQGADPGLADDLTPASLDRIWEALSPLLAWQDGWEPDEMQPGIQPTIEALGDLSALPSWLDPISGPIWLSPTSLWIVDGVGRHLGNVMVANVPGMRWSLGPTRVRTSYRNQPVVTDQGGEHHNPLEGAAVIASRNLKELRTNGPDSPWQYYEMRAAFWRPDAEVEPGSVTPPASTTTSTCRCGEHVAQVADLTVPFAASAGAEPSHDAHVTVAQLIARDALAAEEVEGEPGRWMLWFGDETRLHYDDEALLSLEDVVALAPGVSDVTREDRESVLVQAPGRCADAMLTIAARALLDDRVRLREGSS